MYLVVIKGRVCIECTKETKGSFYHCGAYYKHFTRIEDAGGKDQ